MNNEIYSDKEKVYNMFKDYNLISYNTYLSNGYSIKLVFDEYINDIDFL